MKQVLHELKSVGNFLQDGPIQSLQKLIWLPDSFTTLLFRNNKSKNKSARTSTKNCTIYCHWGLGVTCNKRRGKTSSWSKSSGWDNELMVWFKTVWFHNIPRRQFLPRWSCFKEWWTVYQKLEKHLQSNERCQFTMVNYSRHYISRNVTLINFRTFVIVLRNLFPSFWS